MKLFKDGLTSITDPVLEKDLMFSDLIKICVGKAPINGLTIEQQRKHFKIMDRFDAIKDNEVEFEDDEWIIIKNCVNTFPWAVAHKDLIGLGDYIDSVK